MTANKYPEEFKIELIRRYFNGEKRTNFAKNILLLNPHFEDGCASMAHLYIKNLSLKLNLKYLKIWRLWIKGENAKILLNQL